MINKQLSRMLTRSQDFLVLEKITQSLSGTTISGDWLNGIRYFQNLSENANPENSFIIYGGFESKKRSEWNIVSWKDAVSTIKKCL